MATDPRGRLEEYLLSSIIINRNFNSGAVEEDFKNELLKEVFREFMKDTDNDLVTLGVSLEGPLSHKLQTITSVVPDLNPEAYLKRLREVNKTFVVKDAIDRVGDNNPDILVEEINKLKKKLNTNVESERVRDVCKRLFVRFENASKDPDKLSGVTSGIPVIDNITWGFQESKVYILAGRPSMGKSALAVNIALNAALEGKNVYYQSLEEPIDSVVSRMISILSDVRNENLNKGRIEPNDWPKIISAIEKISGLPITIDESTGLSSGEIINKVIARNDKEKIDLMVLDHIQEISEKAESRRLEISFAASRLRGLSKSLRIPLLLVSQLSRAVESRSEKRPLMSDLRESGELEAIADVVMLLYRESYYNKACNNDDIEVSFSKNRNGRTGIVFVGFDPTRVRITSKI